MVHKSMGNRVVAYPIQLISFTLFDKPFKELDKDSKNSVMLVWEKYQKKFYEKTYNKYGRQEKLW